MDPIKPSPWDADKKPKAIVCKRVDEGPPYVPATIESCAKCGARIYVSTAMQPYLAELEAMCGPCVFDDVAASDDQVIEPFVTDEVLAELSRAFGKPVIREDVLNAAKRGMAQELVQRLAPTPQPFVVSGLDPEKLLALGLRMRSLSPVAREEATRLYLSIVGDWSVDQASGELTDNQVKQLTPDDVSALEALIERLEKQERH